MPPPAISIIIPAYNRAYCIGETLRNLLAQTFTDFEVIVVDDGSTDHTAEVVRSFTDRVRLVMQSNRGVSAARNTGVRQARGRWIAFQDSDDLWHPKKLERQLEVLQKHGKSWCATTAVDESGVLLSDVKQVAANQLESTVYFVAQPAETIVVAAKHPYLQSMILEKSLVEKAGLFAEDLFAAEDTEFIFRLSLMAGMCFIAEPLTIISQLTPDSLTRNTDPKIREKRFDGYTLAQERIYAELVKSALPLKRQVRAHISYYRLSRAELACVAGEFTLARRLAGKDLVSGGDVRIKLRRLAIWCCPSLWQKMYQKKWEGQAV